MISVLLFGLLWWSSQHPYNRETGYNNVLGCNRTILTPKTTTAYSGQFGSRTPTFNVRRDSVASILVISSCFHFQLGELLMPTTCPGWRWACRAAESLSASSWTWFLNSFGERSRAWELFVVSISHLAMGQLSSCQATYHGRQVGLITFLLQIFHIWQLAIGNYFWKGSVQFDAKWNSPLTKLSLSQSSVHTPYL